MTAVDGGHLIRGARVVPGDYPGRERLIVAPPSSIRRGTRLVFTPRWIYAGHSASCAVKVMVSPLRTTVSSTLSPGRFSWSR
jgi:hypothetical protein